MLPIGPIGKCNSPYSSPSSFAIEPLLVSLDALVDDGLLPKSALKAPEILKKGNVRYTGVRRFKEPRLRAAFKQFVALRGDRRAAYRRFVDEQQSWLEPWCTWASENQGGDPDQHAFTQFILDRQWRTLRRAARERRILLYGDLPIFVPLDSADVASNPKLFKLRANGKPELVSGVPPDRFNKDGQLWGHPQYRWPMHEKTRFHWLTDRVAKQFDRFDIVRIDHFIGLYRLWQIPANATSAHEGSWERTPGRALLKRIFRVLKDPALVAEDLGRMIPAVSQLRDDFALPGLYLLQHAFERDEVRWLPSELPRRAIVYPGTHDNDTAEGWWRSLKSKQRRRLLEYGGPLGKGAHEILLRLALASTANAAIIPMQDLLGLGRIARMNTPGKAKGNWRWRMNQGMLRSSQATKLRRLAARTERLGIQGRKTRATRQ
jgi:4-alpha-glucanotransferase